MSLFGSSDEMKLPVASPEAIMQDIKNFRRCFICQKYIGGMVDIYLYMDKGFCSNECRSKVMDNDTQVLPKINQAKMKKPVRKSRRKDYIPVRFVPVNKKQEDRDSPSASASASSKE